MHLVELFVSRLADRIPQKFTRRALFPRCCACSDTAGAANTDIAPSLARSCQQFACDSDERPAHSSGCTALTAVRLLEHPPDAP